MRLTALTLTHYGNFKSDRILFDPEPGVVNVLLAPNGGGKSVLRNAFGDLLFNISGQSPMGFRHGYAAMRIMAEAVDQSRNPFVFGRRKGQGNTLINAEGGALEPAAFARHLGAIDRKRLERLFALDTELLRQGQSALLASDGELSSALVSAGGGTRDARALRQSLEDDRDALAPRRRSASRPFYIAADQYIAARKRKESSLLRPEQWERFEQQAAEARRRQADANTTADRETTEITRLERIRRVLPWMAARDAAAAWLDSHPDAPVLDPSLATALADARTRIVLAENQLARERQAAAETASQLEQLTVNEALLAEAAEIDRLVDSAGAARKAAIDMPAVEAEAQAAADTIHARLRELGLSLTPDQAADAVPPRALINQARRLSQAYPALHGAALNAPTHIAERERDAAAVRAQAEALPPANDTAALEALVREIRAHGDPLRTMQERTAQRAEAAAALAAARARVPGWTQDDAVLLALRPLTDEHYQRHADEVATARASAQSCLDRLRQARQDRDEASAKLASLSATKLPDAGSLGHARRRRDQGWHLIYRRAFTPDPPTAVEEREFTGDLPLPLVYERAVTAADDVADRLLDQAALVERAEAAKADLQRADTQLQRAETEHRFAAERFQATERAWTQLCSPLGTQPAIQDVRSFLTARDKVIAAHQSLATADAALSALAASHAAWQARLADAMKCDAATSLPDLLAVAERRLTDARKIAEFRAALQAGQEAAAKALAEAQATHRHAAASLDSWRTDWSKAMEALRRPPDEDPHVTADLLQVFADLDQALKQRADRTTRVRGMQQEIEGFSQATTALATRLAPDLAPQDAFQVITTLRTRLQHTRERARQRETLRQQSEAGRQAENAADQAWADSTSALQAILVLIGSDTDEHAERRLAEAAERARHAAALDDADRNLMQAGDLRPQHELRQDIASVPIDAIPDRIATATQRRKQAQDAAQQEAAEVAAHDHQMTQIRDATAATDTAADQQAAVAKMSTVLQDALVYHIAAEMLDRALTAVEQDQEPELLRRIGALFARLTRGAYSRVQTEPDDKGTARLTLIQRDHPDEQQYIHQLSEGTRDQLFLALRLAAIEEYAASAPPLPLIGDDILQTFDDDRALAALEALKDISATVQVILLTHHRHILDLARHLPPGSFHVCEIAGAQPVA
jgi:uncharacterized protein YhaN